MGVIARLLSLIVCIILPVSWSAVAYAQSAEIIVSKVLITELQTESELSANEEFVEITNISDELIDLSGWVLQYRSATGSSWLDKALLSGSLYIDGSIVISTQGYNVENSTFFWTSASGQLAATGGNVRLLAPGQEIAEDTLAWGSGIYGELLPALKAPKGMSLHRKKVIDNYVDTNDNSLDFVKDLADPVNLNKAPDPINDPAPDEPVDETPVDNPADPVDIPTDSIDNGEITPPIETPNEEVPAEVEPEQTQDNLLPILITELMINPESPELDSTDEWVELYNPNSDVFDLTGYKVQAGSSYSYTYLFTGVLIQPFGYTTISSGDSNLALSNTSGAVRLLGRDGAIHGVGVTYEDVEEGNTYALDGLGQWQWTTTPTKGGFNVFTEAPVVTKLASATKKATVVKAATTKTSTAKTAATKAAAKATSAKATKTAATSSFVPDSAVETQRTRPLLLASFAVLAVLYGLYEYRDDISNNLWRARRYIALRRKARQVL